MKMLMCRVVNIDIVDIKKQKKDMLDKYLDYHWNWQVPLQTNMEWSPPTTWGFKSTSQVLAIEVISRGTLHTLIIIPTDTGKTFISLDNALDSMLF